MKVAVDISLYPLQEDLIPPIKNVIERLSSHDNLYVDTNSMSTQIRGEYEVFDVSDIDDLTMWSVGLAWVF